MKVLLELINILEKTISKLLSFTGIDGIIILIVNRELILLAFNHKLILLVINHELILCLLKIMKITFQILDFFLIEVLELNIAGSGFSFNHFLQLVHALLMVLISVEIWHEFVGRAIMLEHLDVIHHFCILLDNLSG